ncbi:hypothetical protein, partial [Providencia sp. PROV193]|uniref:hypothetical protein n=1 Tax=Providencia sp. PROV193 TaxID=2949894 RepID=UPI00234B49C6
MSKIFKDIRALKLRDSDGWKSSDSATYGEIKNNYSFIGFVPIDEGSQNSDNESLKPKDWLFEAMLQDAKDVPLKYIIEKTTPRMDKRFRISDKQRRIDYINQLEWCNSTQNAHQFHRPITGDVRTEMKRALKEKEEIYKKFCTHYDEVKAQEKSVAILPLHLTFSRDVFFDNQENKYQLSYSILREAISYLTEKFSELIKKIGKRSAYQHVVAFDRLVLLRDDITPYLHVNFYFEDNDFSDFYLRDIVREWCLLTEYDCRVDYIQFQDSLSEIPGEDDTMMEDYLHDSCV